MKRSLTLISLLCFIAACAGNKTLYTFDFQSDPTKAGWNYVPSKKSKDEKVYVPSEGWYLNKGAKWQSPKIKCTDDPWQFYNLTFKSKAEKKCYWAVFFQKADGKNIVADDYASMYKSKDWADNDCMFRGRELAETFTVNFMSNEKIAVKDMKVTTATTQDVCEWADALYAKLPPLEYTPPADRLARIPETIQRLREGGPIRMVMLGDSIINDTNNSNFDALLMRMYPKSDIRVITSVRGSTGCWHYQKPEHFKSYVIDRKPDVLIIGGISQRGKIDPIKKVIRMTKEKIGCEIILMSGPVGREWRKRDKNNPDKPLEKQKYKGSDFPTKLQKLADEEGVEFIDMHHPWHTYLGRSGKPYMWFHRDGVHANDRGKQILARIIEKYFQPKK